MKPKRLRDFLNSSKSPEQELLDKVFDEGIETTEQELFDSRVKVDEDLDLQKNLELADTNGHSIIGVEHSVTGQLTHSIICVKGDSPLALTMVKEVMKAFNTEYDELNKTKKSSFKPTLQ